MTRFANFLFSSLLIMIFIFSATLSKADGVKGKAEKVWTRWELSTSADIYYRVEVFGTEPSTQESKTIAVEFLNNYKKDVSFCFTLNASGTPDANFQLVLNLKRKKSTIVEYPRASAGSEIKMTISSLQLEK